MKHSVLSSRLRSIRHCECWVLPDFLFQNIPAFDCATSSEHIISCCILHRTLQQPLFHAAENSRSPLLQNCSAITACTFNSAQQPRSNACARCSLARSVCASVSGIFYTGSPRAAHQRAFPGQGECHVCWWPMCLRLAATCMFSAGVDMLLHQGCVRLTHAQTLLGHL